MFRKYWLYPYLLISCFMMAAGFIFEEPHGDRFWILLGLTVYYLTALLITMVRSGKVWTLPSLVLSMAIALIAIEMNSKYAVNYFYHTIYILLIFFCIVSIRSKVTIGLSSAVTALSFIKFIQLIAIQRTFANIALLVFFGSVQILIVVVGIFLRVYQEETQKTKKLYGELLDSHNQLKAYAEEIRDLTQVEARTKIARDLHDTLGHELTGLIMQMEMAGTCFEQSDEAAGLELLQASKKSARESLAKVRRIVETLKTDSESGGEKASIKELIDDFAMRTGCTIHYHHRGDRQLKPSKRLVLYRIIQESLTNAIRHGHATEIEVTLIYGSDDVNFEISNNGGTTEHIEEGNGLKGMKDRVTEVGGYLEAEGTPMFRVWGRLPYEES